MKHLKTKKIIRGMIMLRCNYHHGDAYRWKLRRLCGSFCVITGCLSERQAYDSIDCHHFPFAGMIRWRARIPPARGNSSRIYSGGSVDPPFLAVVLDAVHDAVKHSLPCDAAAQVGGPRGKFHGDSYRILLCFCKSCGPPNTSCSRPGKSPSWIPLSSAPVFVVICLVVSIAVIPVVWSFFPNCMLVDFENWK